MKKIEDYLHLYLGCEMWEKDGLSYKLTTDMLHKYLLMPYAIQNGLAKPILRPLGSMTEEEKVRLCLWEFSNYKSAELSKNNSDSAMIVFINENGQKCYLNTHHFSPETTRKLLNAGFDLFGLIEAGLAIPKKPE